jgi:hypothetical protein
MRLRCVVAAFVCLAASSPAAADPTAQDLATARTLYNEGVDLREKGDLQGAMARLQAAYALVPTPIIGLELGNTQLTLGKLVEARETLYAASHLPPSPAESKAGLIARQEGARLAESLRPRIPALRIDVKGASERDGLHVSVDGETVPAQVLRLPFKVNPGKHHVTASARAAEAHPVDVEVAEGEERAVTLELSPGAAAAPEAPASPPPRAPEEPVATGDGRGLERGIGVGVAALGLAALVGGASLAKMAQSRWDDATAHCPTNATCDYLGLSITHDARTFAIRSTVFVVAGAVLVSTGAFVFFFVGKKHASASARAYPVMGAGFAGAAIEQRW